MKHDLDKLKITARELENLTGFEVNEIFIGSVLGGVYRPSISRSIKRATYFCLTEAFVFVLIFIFTLPFGFLVIRNSPNVINDSATIFRFLQITLGITLVAITGWNIYMVIKLKPLKTLAHLLDEVDKYNEVIQAIDVLDRLEAVGNIQATVINREQVLAALNLAKNSLFCGLMTEKILRENRNLLARRYELFANIENNLTNLRTLKLNNQANEYTEFLNEALQIGMSVYQELKKSQNR
jgi:hypothetical protein